MIEVKFDESFIPGIEDEAIEVEHLLAEPKDEHVSVDGVLSFGNDSQGKCLEIKDVSCRLETDLKANSGMLDSNTALQGEADVDFVLDGFLDEVDEVEDIHATDGLSSPCDDYLLDIEFADKVSELDCGPHEGSRLGNSSSESHSPGFSGSSNGVVGVSESSTGTIPEPEGKNDMHDQNVICKIHGVCRGVCGCLTVVKDMCIRSPASDDLLDIDELDNDLKPFVGGISYDKKKKSSIETTKVVAHLRQKRMRKPTKRFIEESSDPKSIDSRGTQKISVTTSRDKHLKASPSNEHRHIRVKALALVKEECNSGASIQAPLEVRVQRGRRKKQASISESESESDEEYLMTESEDDSVTTKKSRKGSDRRKQQRMWTLSEVTNLVDGISQFGVGRWTDIKRLLFSSSTYRTPVDLRDKWRNLLRTSRAQKHSGREVEEKSKDASRLLPKSIVRRINELDTIHPYPRERSSNISNDTPPSLPKSSKVAQVNPRGRNVRRKKCTRESSA